MAKKNSKKDHSLSTEQRLGIGVGITAAAAAAVGTYFLYGSKDAEKNRKKVRSWMLKAKAEVLEGLERAQEMSKDEYEELVNTIGAAYAGLQDASKKDIKEFKEEMKGHWETIESYAKKGKKKAAKKATTAKKQATKTATKAKKAATKTAKKATKTAKKAAKTNSKKSSK